MLNDGWDEGMTTAESDAAAEEMMRDAHPCCLECEQPGCLREDCPSSFCEVAPLVTCHGELVHAGCVEAFERHIENRCDGTTCHCPADGIPLAVDVEETTPVAPLTDRQIAALDPLGVFRSLAAVAALVLAAVTAQGCTAHVAAPEVEQVGQLATGPSVYSAPLKHDAPPALGFVAGSDDDAPGDVVTTTTRVDAGESDAAPEVVGKGGGLTAGEVR